MKLAEALMIRADLQKRLEQVRSRLSRVAVVQEGDKPAEDPKELLDELHSIIGQLERSIVNINQTNHLVELSPYGSIADAITKRELLMKKRSVIEKVIEHATVGGHRYSASEIKLVPTVDVQQLQKQLDDLSKQYREIDTAIQQANWLTELVEK